MGEMGDDHGVGTTAGFVQEYEVAYALGEEGGDKGSDDGVASVQAVRVWKDEAEFLSNRVSSCSAKTKSGKDVRERVGLGNICGRGREKELGHLLWRIEVNDWTVIDWL